MFQQDAEQSIRSRDIQLLAAPLMKGSGFRTGGGFAVPSCRTAAAAAASADATRGIPPAANAMTPRFIEELLSRTPSPRTTASTGATPPGGMSLFRFDCGAPLEKQRPAGPKPPSPREHDLHRSPRSQLSPRPSIDDPFALLGQEKQMQIRTTSPGTTAVPPPLWGSGGSPSAGSRADQESPRADRAPRASPTPSMRYTPRQAAAAATTNGSPSQDATINPARVPFPSLRHARHLETIAPQPIDRRQPPRNRDESAVHRMSTEALHPRRHDERLSRLYSAKAAYSPGGANDDVRIAACSRCP